LPLKRSIHSLDESTCGDITRDEVSVGEYDPLSCYRSFNGVGGLTEADALEGGVGSSEVPLHEFRPKIMGVVEKRVALQFLGCLRTAVLLQEARTADCNNVLFEQEFGRKSGSERRSAISDSEIDAIHLKAGSTGATNWPNGSPTRTSKRCAIWSMKAWAKTPCAR